MSACNKCEFDCNFRFYQYKSTGTIHKFLYVQYNQLTGVWHSESGIFPHNGDDDCVTNSNNYSREHKDWKSSNCKVDLEKKRDKDVNFCYYLIQCDQNYISHVSYTISNKTCQSRESLANQNTAYTSAYQCYHVW